MATGRCAFVLDVGNQSGYRLVTMDTVMTFGPLKLGPLKGETQEAYEERIRRVREWCDAYKPAPVDWTEGPARGRRGAGVVR